MAWSGGGPVAYQLAPRHTHRVSALDVKAAVSSAWIAPKTHITERIMFGTKLGDRIIKSMSSQSLKYMLEGALEGEGFLLGEEL